MLLHAFDEFRRRGFQEIVDGKHDDLPEAAFYMVGTIEDAVAKARGGEREREPEPEPEERPEAEEEPELEPAGTSA